ncbi:thiosulfate dehydrogenase [Chitinophaga niastensis]|uniref:Thiosulfate dehydrogenase n=1 Tax=Chitinophaga niastensis TaxID=536980 RepID=A0A2P8HEZ9_CHINA|nr:c-type cytochrome [Chitinophaga niastensis]PSL44786.1 thiosulfate dehydrogenase [Chitinophaga niastensis]
MPPINSPKRIVTACLLMATGAAIFYSCQTDVKGKEKAQPVVVTPSLLQVDTAAIPNDKFGEAVRYGMELMYNTAYYIGPAGVNGKYLGNKMNCNNCHQQGGTKPFSFNLMLSHEHYPQYRAREGHVLTLAERVNNCVTRPHNGKPLPLDSKEMVAFLSYFRWINSFVPKEKPSKGAKNLEVTFPDVAASPERGEPLFMQHCARCHGKEGEGKMRADNITYTYPPLWGNSAYQPGSSMHRIIKQAQWLKANMPYDKATWDKPFLSDAEAMDIAAFVNDDAIHHRPDVKSFDYPHLEEKALDYDRGPFADTFSIAQHKYGPYEPMISYWKNKGLKAAY